MPGKIGPRPALILWAVFAFVIWNVVFDRRVYEASVSFTQDQIVTIQAGRPVAPIEGAFRPQVRRAALEASVWAGSVLAVGVVVILVLNRRYRQ